MKTSVWATDGHTRSLWCVEMSPFSTGVYRALTSVTPTTTVSSFSNTRQTKPRVKMRWRREQGMGDLQYIHRLNVKVVSCQPHKSEILKQRKKLFKSQCYSKHFQRTKIRSRLDLLQYNILLTT
jgi:hypothetical protein